MRSVIRIGQREVAVESNAATAIRYKQIFKRELLKDLAKLENVEDVDKLDAIEYTSKLAYVMNMQNRKEIKEASEEGYIAWMEEFEEADFQDPAAITSILNVWNRNITTTSELKKTKVNSKEMNTNIFMLRAFSLHISMHDLEELTHGDVLDMMIESSNDTYNYPLKATQDDFDKFAAM